MLARRFYDYCTKVGTYSFMREYFTLPDSIPDYYGTGLKGDCGVQALLFITLCRYAGIPAKWQSGLFVTERHDFYFGNLDPFRMVANSELQAEFDPPKQHLRIDPFDNQRGEAEYADHGLIWIEVDEHFEMLEMTKLT